MDPDQLRETGKKMIDYVSDYWSSMRDRAPVAEVQPGYMRKLVPDKVPKHPEPWHKIFEDLDQVIMKGVSIRTLLNNSEM